MLKPPLTIDRDGYSGTLHTHVDARGVAWIDDTNVKVVEIVAEQQAQNWTPENVQAQHPGLSLAQIYAALAYYHDNRAALNAQIEREKDDYERARADAAAQFPTRQELEARLLSPSRTA